MRIGFIGTGAMSSAIATGFRESGNTEPEIYLYDVNTESAGRLAAAVSGTVVADPADLIPLTDIVLLGVKPQVQTVVLEGLSPHLTNPPALLSIAAGRSLEAITADLAGAPEMPHLIRVMPNVNAQIGLSMSEITFTPGTPDEVRRLARQLMEAVGEVMDLPEDHFAVFTALAGCSPAWFFQVVEDLARAGVKHGLTKDQALAAVVQSMLGSARLLQISAAEGVNPAALTDRVTSPGGTTIAGLLAAEEAGLTKALVKAVDAAVARDIELGAN